MSASHAEIEELLGAYVCDAVEPDERAAVEHHLPSCEACRAEVSELREVTALLASADAASAVPEGVWDRIVSSMDEPPPPLRLSVVTSQDGAPVAPRAARRRIAAFAAAAAVVVGVVGFAIGRTTEASGPGAGGLEAAAQHAVAAAGARHAQLIDAARVVRADAVVGTNGEGYLLGQQLPAIGERVYQLWAATSSGAVISLGVLAQPGVIAFSVGDPSSVTALMITEETRPVDRPSGAPTLQGRLG